MAEPLRTLSSMYSMSSSSSVSLESKVFRYLKVLEDSSLEHSDFIPLISILEILSVFIISPLSKDTKKDCLSVVKLHSPCYV